MKKELENKIVSAHPLLYRDINDDKEFTCMHWGIDVGDGWYDLIWNLSQKLEPIIQEFINQSLDLNCAYCGCKEDAHYDTTIIDFYSKGPIRAKCNTIHHLPYMLIVKSSCAVPQWKRDFINSLKNYRAFKKFWYYGVWAYFKWQMQLRIYKPLNDFFHLLYERWGIGYEEQCYCSGFRKNHPCAAQVKQKMGGLCFYMHLITDEMYGLIKKAESDSYSICENCGQPGKIRNRGYIRVLCDKCKVINRGWNE